MSKPAVEASRMQTKGLFQTLKDSFSWRTRNSELDSIARTSDGGAKGATTVVTGSFSNKAKSVARARTNAITSELPSVAPDSDGGHVGTTSSSNDRNSVAEAPTDAAGTDKNKIGAKFGKKKVITSSSSAVPRVEICLGKKCKARGSEDLLASFQSSSEGRVEIGYTTCMKACKQGMNVRVTKDGAIFDMHNGVDTGNCEQILSKHFEW